MSRRSRIRGTDSGRVTQTLERVAQVVQRLSAHGLDAVERLDRLRGLLASDVNADRRLRADRRDAVRDDVVHVLRDLHALLVEPLARLQFTLARGAVGPVAHGSNERPLAADRLPHGQRKCELREPLQHLRELGALLG
jgi:hypothetical protein